MLGLNGRAAILSLVLLVVFLGIWEIVNEINSAVKSAASGVEQRKGMGTRKVSCT